MAYTTAQSVRTRGGLCDSIWSDTALDEKIALASAFVNQVTGQWFEAREQVISLDGRGTMTLLVPIPIVEVTKIEIIDWPVLPGGAAEVSLDAVAIYNRHLTEQLTNPDDRKNPRITWTSTESGRRTVFVNKWPEGVRNIRLTGRFGFTEYDGLIPNYGRTPLLIKDVVERLVLRDLPATPNSDGGGMDGYRYEAAMRAAGRVTREKVRDQEIQYAQPSASVGNVGGIITGDPYIDMILLDHRRPPRFRSTDSLGDES